MNFLVFCCLNFWTIKIFLISEIVVTINHVRDSFIPSVEHRYIPTNEYKHFYCHCFIRFTVIKNGFINFHAACHESGRKEGRYTARHSACNGFRKLKNKLLKLLILFALSNRFFFYQVLNVDLVKLISRY